MAGLIIDYLFQLWLASLNLYYLPWLFAISIGEIGGKLFNFEDNAFCNFVKKNKNKSTTYFHFVQKYRTYLICVDS